MQNRSVRWLDAGGLILFGIGLFVALNGCEGAGRNESAQPEVPASTSGAPQTSPKTQPIISAPATALPPAVVSPPPAPAAPLATMSPLDGRGKAPAAPPAGASPPPTEPLRARPDDPPPAPQPPQPDEAAAPDFVAILDTIEPGKPARVVVEQESDRRLSLSTRNVRRIRIDRAAAQLASNRSVSLQLDGQGIEWAARSVTREFERTRSGLWQPVEPTAPR